MKEERKIIDDAREFDITHSVVSRLWIALQTRVQYSRRKLGWRPLSTTPENDPTIILTSKSNRRVTADQMASKCYADTLILLSRKTFSRHLRQTGLYA